MILEDYQCSWLKDCGIFQDEDSIIIKIVREEGGVLEECDKDSVSWNRRFSLLIKATTYDKGLMKKISVIRKMIHIVCEMIMITDCNQGLNSIEKYYPSWCGLYDLPMKKMALVHDIQWRA